MKKALLVVLALVLVAALSVGLTMAYLTSTTAVAENTFTTGDVEITLDEAKVTAMGVKDGDDRVTRNTYKLIPGHNYVKDPTVYVASDSEECWVFVQVKNGIADFTQELDLNANLLAIDATKGIYAYNTTLNAGEKIVVFTDFTVLGSADLNNVADDAAITVQAYAVQADNFTTPQAAWAAAPLAAWTTVTP